MRASTFERYVREAVQSLPLQFQAALDNVEIVIEDRPSRAVMEQMGEGPPLLGLYQGTPLPERELGEVSLPDKISIYREEILDLGLTGTDLVEEIRLTVLHELGHYFGLDDDEMEEWEPDYGVEREEGDEEEHGA
jgi:predicted Zn-dependent protease with MMP-like domain